MHFGQGLASRSPPSWISPEPAHKRLHLFLHVSLTKNTKNSWHCPWKRSLAPHLKWKLKHFSVFWVISDKESSIKDIWKGWKPRSVKLFTRFRQTLKTREMFYGGCYKTSNPSAGCSTRFSLVHGSDLFVCLHLTIRANTRCSIKEIFEYKYNFLHRL